MKLKHRIAWTILALFVLLIIVGFVTLAIQVPELGLMFAIIIAVVWAMLVVKYEGEKES